MTPHTTLLLLQAQELELDHTPYMLLQRQEILVRSHDTGCDLLTAAFITIMQLWRWVSTQEV